MTNSPGSPGRPSASAPPLGPDAPRPSVSGSDRLLRPRTDPRAAAALARLETLELRDLLDANLQALRALHEEHQRMLQTSLRAIDAVCTELRSELHALASARAPWVRAMSETRALLFVALRELVVGEHEAELAMHLSDQDPDPRAPR